MGRWRRWCAYIIYKSLGKVEKLSKRDIWRLAKILLHEYEKAIDSTVERLVVKTSVVNSMGNPQDANGEWWARGDLNPGPPPCEGGVLTRLDDGPIASRGIPLGARLVAINLSRPLPQGAFMARPSAGISIILQALVGLATYIVLTVICRSRCCGTAG